MKNGVRLAACGWRLAAGGWRRAVRGKGSKLSIQGKGLALFRSQCLIVRDLQDLHDLHDLQDLQDLSLPPEPCPCAFPLAACRSQFLRVIVRYSGFQENYECLKKISVPL